MISVYPLEYFFVISLAILLALLTFEFYAPIQQWIEEYFKTENKTTIISFDINYLNSSSIKFYYDLFETLETTSQNGVDIKVKWIYDEEDDMALETGEEFQEVVLIASNIFERVSGRL